MRSKLPAVESVPQQPGIILGVFWFIDPHTLVGLGGLNPKPARGFVFLYFFRESTPKPADGFGVLTPIFWGIHGLGVGSPVLGSFSIKPLLVLVFYKILFYFKNVQYNT
jgi:hypothetical protein